MNEEITRMLDNITPEQFAGVIKYLDAQKIEKEAITKGTNQEEIIRIYLEGLSKNDPELAAKFPNNPMKKGMKDCMKYIESIARKTRQPIMTSFDVFNHAVQYFLDDSIQKIDQPKPASKTPAVTPKVDIQALLDEKEKWEAENKAKIDEWEIAQNAKIDKWDKDNTEDLFGNKPENPFAKEQNPYLNMTFPKQLILDKAIEAQKNSKSTSADAPTEAPAEEPENNEDEMDDTAGELEYEEEEDNNE